MLIYSKWRMPSDVGRQIHPFFSAMAMERVEEYEGTEEYQKALRKLRQTLYKAIRFRPCVVPSQAANRRQMSLHRKFSIRFVATWYSISVTDVAVMGSAYR